MLERLYLRNFQSYVSQEIVFNPGVNVFIGKSDSGKSAIIRALRWLVNNRPLGLAYRRHNTQPDRPMTVMVNLDSNHIVSHSKTPNINEYSITGPDKTKRGLKAIGTDVPEEVSRLLNLNTINFQYQVTLPFLLTETPGQAAQILNQALNLSQIDWAFSTVKQSLDNTKRDAAHWEKEVARWKATASEYSWLEVAGKLTDDAVSVQKEIEITQTAHNELFGKIEAIKICTTGYKKTNWTIPASILLENAYRDKQRISTITERKEYGEKVIDRIITLNILKENIDGWLPFVEDAFREANKVQLNLQRIQSMVTRLQALVVKIKSNQEQVNAIIYTEAHEKTIDEALTILKNKAVIEDKKTNLINLLRGIEVTRNAMYMKEQEIERQTMIFKTTFPEACPLCDRPM